MFDLVSFPIIPALLVSPKPLAQSWSPRFKNTHMWTHPCVFVQGNTHARRPRYTRTHVFEPRFGFTSAGLRWASRISSTPRTGSPCLQTDKMRKRERERGTEAEAESWIKDKWGGGVMRDIWARHLVKRLSDRDTRQRFGMQRGEDGKSKKAAETKAKVQIWCYQYAQKKTEWRSRACYVI